MARPDDGGDDLVADAGQEIALADKPIIWPSFDRCVDGLRVVDVLYIDDFPWVPEHRQMILLALLLAMKDQAREVRFEPWRFGEAETADPGVRMLYQVGDELIEMPPPPTSLAAPLFDDLKGVAGLNAPRRRIADLLRRLAARIDGQTQTLRQGRFLLNLGVKNAIVEVLVCDSELGDRYLLKMPPIPSGIPEVAEREMSRLLRLWFLDKCWYPPRR